MRGLHVANWRRSVRVALSCLGPAFVACVFAASVWGQEEQAVIVDTRTPCFEPGTFGQDKTPVGTVETVEGQLGKACRLSFVEGASGGFFTARIRATAHWDQAAGISFWVKGDGSESWGGLELIDDGDFALRYGYCLPIDSTEWRKIVIPWRDLLPELPAGKPVDAKTGYPPSRFGYLWFGKWYYWRDYPAHSYAVERIALETTIPGDATLALPATAGVPRLLEKLRAGQPVTIVTMGDSLSDKRHWANQQTLWSEVLAAQIEATYGSEVTLVNPAIGGTQLTQNLILMPRWLKGTPEPDLVTVWFGYNDWDSGMRGEGFAQTLGVAVDRVRRMTGGRSEIMLMTTCPAVERWDTMDELADAARTVAAEKRTGLADIARAFHAEGADEAARAPLYCSDQVHLGKRGHVLTAQTVLQAIAGGQ